MTGARAFDAGDDRSDRDGHNGPAPETDVVEHLVVAARDLIGAARSVLDAMEAVLDEQTEARGRRGRDRDRDDPNAPPQPGPRLRRIDIDE